MGHHTESPQNRLKVTKEARWQNCRRSTRYCAPGKVAPEGFGEISSEVTQRPYSRRSQISDPTAIFPRPEPLIKIRKPLWPITCPCPTLASDRAQARSTCAERHFARRDGLSPISGGGRAPRGPFLARQCQRQKWTSRRPSPTRYRRQTIASREVALGALRVRLRSIAHEYPDSRCLRKPSNLILSTIPI